MPVTAVRKDPEQLSMTIVGEYPASPERLWQLWEDPRRLERWWGPPMYPATFDELDLRAGGSARYHMTGPNGETPRGWWRVLAVDPPRRIEIEDGFADEAGRPTSDLPTTRFVVTIAPIDGGARMEIRTTFPSAEAMEQVLAMGAEEGMTQALGQIDELLAADVPA